MVVYRVEYYDTEDDYWCNADQALTPIDFPTYEAAVGFRNHIQQFEYGKLRIVERTIATKIIESD